VTGRYEPQDLELSTRDTPTRQVRRGPSVELARRASTSAHDPTSSDRSRAAKRRRRPAQGLNRLVAILTLARETDQVSAPLDGRVHRPFELVDPREAQRAVDLHDQKPESLRDRRRVGEQRPCPPDVPLKDENEAKLAEAGAARRARRFLRGDELATDLGRTRPFPGLRIV
jgi:hypothetical protein